MAYNADIGAKIKKLRTKKNYTLQDLSRESGLSIGFLSQMERGMSAIAVETLANIAEILDTDLKFFFKKTNIPKINPVIRNHEKEYSVVNEQIIQYFLTDNVEAYNILPRLYELLPFHSSESADPGLYHHSGEEFIYVLEGVLTLFYQDNEYLLYSGDSIMIKSNIDHNWINSSNKIVKFISVNSPNPYKTDEK